MFRLTSKQLKLAWLGYGLLLIAFLIVHSRTPLLGVTFKLCAGILWSSFLALVFLGIWRNIQKEEKLHWIQKAWIGFGAFLIFMFFVNPLIEILPNTVAVWFFFLIIIGLLFLLIATATKNAAEDEKPTTERDRIRRRMGVLLLMGSIWYALGTTLLVYLRGSAHTVVSLIWYGVDAWFFITISRTYQRLNRLPKE